ncbi:VOC family protein [Cohnella sp. REN36]|uniref:VOC family protein n=1 Tax=Cohnella sp. REN36 TaxID=2887347 RepID=UPI001D14698F|nr:VOC family protein [Cohnella sp. REN36]MCC3371650.1 VOC family protein [Cohnella sp. REN36]
MSHLRPYLLSKDARAQADFYVRALGGEIVSVLTHAQAMGTNNEYNDKVMHMCLTLTGGDSLFLADAIEPLAHGNAVMLTIAYPTESEARDAFAKLSEGGRVKTPFAFQPFGIYYGDLTDPFGVEWSVTIEPKA